MEGTAWFAGQRLNGLNGMGGLEFWILIILVGLLGYDGYGFSGLSRIGPGLVLMSRVMRLTNNCSELVLWSPLKTGRLRASGSQHGWRAKLLEI
jgi:hypothetical protein